MSGIENQLQESNQAASVNTCSDCSSFATIPGTLENGMRDGTVCRGAPPVPIAMPGPQAGSIQIIAMFPPVAPDQAACGCFRELEA